MTRLVHGIVSLDPPTIRCDDRTFTVTLTAYDDMYEGARITALDETGIVITIECRNVTICLPWGAVLEIEIED